MNISGHILIIDDEASLRKTLARILQQAGFEVTTAENAEQGLDFLNTTAFDLILTDLRMPGIQGLEMLKQIQASDPSLPVILFTAQPDVNSAIEALRHGATDYLLKPLKPETVIERTRAVLATLQKEKRIREISRQIEALQIELERLKSGGANGNGNPLISAEPSRFYKRGVITLDLLARRVTVHDKIVNLPPTSFDYLLVLARHAPAVVDYQTLAAEAQGYQTDVREAQELAKWHIHHIRQVIEPNPQKPIYIINMRGSGYRFVAD